MLMERINFSRTDKELANLKTTSFIQPTKPTVEINKFVLALKRKESTNAQDQGAIALSI